jgi:hypothetical protein
VRTVACGAGCPGDAASLASRFVIAAGGGGAGAVGQMASGGLGGAAGAAGGNGLSDPAGDGGGTGGGAGGAATGGPLGAGGTAAVGRAPGDAGVAGTAGSGGRGGNTTSGGGGGGGGLFGGGGGGGGGAASMVPFDSAGAGGGGGGSSLAPGGTVGVATTAPGVTVAFTLPAPAAPGPVAPAPPAPPVLGALRPAPDTLRPAKTMSIAFDLSAAATVTFDVAPLLAGRVDTTQGQVRCVALPTKSGASATPATIKQPGGPAAIDVLGTGGLNLRSAPAGGTTQPAATGTVPAFPGPAGGIPDQPECRTAGPAVPIATHASAGGPDAITWDGRAAGKPLAAGLYRISALATDAIGQQSAVTTAKIVLQASAAPRVTRFALELAASGKRRELVVGWDDSQAATASLKIIKLVPGRRSGAGVCIPITATSKKGGLHPPLLAVIALGAPAHADVSRANCFNGTADAVVLTHRDVAGSKVPGARRNRLIWDLSVGHGQAGPGHYRATFAVANAAGQRSTPILRSFTVRRRVTRGCLNTLQLLRDRVQGEVDALTEAQAIAEAQAQAKADAFAAGLPFRPDTVADKRFTDLLVQERGTGKDLDARLDFSAWVAPTCDTRSEKDRIKRLRTALSQVRSLDLAFSVAPEFLAPIVESALVEYEDVLALLPPATSSPQA